MKDDVPMEVKKRRLAELNEVLNEISKKKNAVLQGQVVEVLVEGESKKNPDVLSGRTRTNKLVNFVGPKHLIGKMVYVSIEKAQTWTLKGKWVEEASKSPVA
jgi:tRNA-2-methylthio-N6-dimethylallyladenosine synthase